MFNHIRLPRRGAIWIQLLVALAVVAVLSIWAMASFFRESTTTSDDNVLLYTVARGDFESFISEPGNLQSSSNLEIRCRVRSRNSAGTTILKIVDEGTKVKQGEFLVQFDDSVLKTEETAQQILVAQDKAALIQAKSDLANAERTLTEYKEGIFEQEREVINGEVFVAQENLRRSEAHLDHSRRLWTSGFITDIQLKADEFAVEKARKDVAVAERKLNVYEKFTREKMVGEFEAEIEKQKANVEAAENTLKLSQQKLKDTREQIANCHVTAPKTGQVIFANQRDRRENNVVIEEGVSIRDGQKVIMLPDLQLMEVETRINEAHVNKVKQGNYVRVELEADPDLPVFGKVEKVNAYPFPLRWHGAPLEYGAKVRIVDPPPRLRPGLRAKVHIYTTRKKDVLQVPIAAIIEHRDTNFLLVRDGKSWDVRSVQIGAINNNFVVVEDGVEVGDRVSIDPFRYIDRANLPGGNEPVAESNTVSDAIGS